MKMNKIAITLGDFNGIGTEITLKALRFFKNKIEKIKPEFDLKNLKFGMINAKSGEFSFQSLKIACDLYKSGKIKNIVTAPVAKEAFIPEIDHRQQRVLATLLATDQLAAMADERLVARIGRRLRVEPKLVQQVIHLLLVELHRLP